MKDDKKDGKKVSKVSENELNKIVEIISKKCNPEKIILFGSYAYGIPGKDSDLDMLVVVKNSSQPRYKRAREIRKHLWGITNIPKDILVYTVDEINEWKDVKEAFITEAIRRGKVLYERKGRVNK